jgi:DNA-binding FrmR family transcriptional regulator
MPGRGVQLAVAHENAEATGRPERCRSGTILLYSIKDCDMSHTVRNKTTLLARVKRIRGQVEALERALEAEKGCSEIMQQIAAFRGAANGLMTEVIEEHVRTHVASPSITSNASRTRGADELIDIVRAYLR